MLHADWLEGNSHGFVGATTGGKDDPHGILSDGEVVFKLGFGGSVTLGIVPQTPVEPVFDVLAVDSGDIDPLEPPGKILLRVQCGTPRLFQHYPSVFGRGEWVASESRSIQPPFSGHKD